MTDVAVLERRVTALEQEVEGEKLVTRHILEQTRLNADDLAAIKARLANHDRRFDSHDARFDKLDARFDRLDADLRSLRADLPKMVAETLREVLRERDR
ncbi:MAG: hypothetical protein JWQ36_139 [Enterovirga sp.]|jgi:chromosome segregation ATPase|nr:hypothetical protein [Enterovirga sp.]